MTGRVVAVAILRNGGETDEGGSIILKLLKRNDLMRVSLFARSDTSELD